MLLINKEIEKKNVYHDKFYMYETLTIIRQIEYN